MAIPLTWKLLNDPRTRKAASTAHPVWSKRLELLRELIPKASTAAMLVNPTDVSNPELSEMMPAARALGLELSFFPVNTDADIEAAFAAAAQRRIAVLLVSERPFFTVRYTQIPKLAARHTMPVIYGWREYVMAGGLMSYGSSLTDAWTGGGAVHSIKSGLGLTVPRSLLALADEVIE
jgi:putative tryptophan/tyrosine transport system substrate-binding protein